MALYSKRQAGQLGQVDLSVRLRLTWTVAVLLAPGALRRKRP